MYNFYQNLWKPLQRDESQLYCLIHKNYQHNKTKYSSSEYLSIGVFLNAEEGDFVMFKGLNFRMQDKLPF